MEEIGTFMRVACAGLLLGACQPPVVDCFKKDGCTSPDPRGVISGTVVFEGARPHCKRSADGSLLQPIEPIGAVVLTLYRADQLPPPEGRATQPVSFATIPAADLFGDLSEDECLPASWSYGDLETKIGRSTTFEWPEIDLPPQGETVSYQIRAMFDADGDFNPYFAIRNLPTRGDAIGGALEDPTSTTPRFTSITFAGNAASPLGAEAKGVLVSLGAAVTTERPVFSATWKPLDASATFPLTADPVALESGLFELAQLSLHLIDREDAPYLAAFNSVGIQMDFDPFGYAFLATAIDASFDGVPDLHPILGRAGVPFIGPIVVLERARSEAEILAGIPAISLIGSVRPTQALFTRVFAPNLEVLIPPVAVMTIEDASCQADLAALGASGIPIVPPGNVASMYEGVPTECQELPSGRYSIQVFQGNAGGGIREVPRAISQACRQNENGESCGYLEGGTPSGQGWTIPNELGAFPDLQSEQGPEAMFVVADPTPEDVGNDSPSCTQALDPATGAAREVVSAPIPDSCCNAIRHLCGLPLCQSVPLSAEGASSIRMNSARSEQGVPDCLPFTMPTDCCGVE